MNPAPVRPRGWSRRTRRVVFRLAALVGAYGFWGLLAWGAVTVQTYTSTGVSSGTGHPPTVVTTGSTLEQVAPGAVRTILAGFAVALVLATGSVLWRVARRSERVGVTGLIVAGLVGVVSLLGMLTVGIFLAPFAALLTFLALPIAPTPVPTAAPTPGPLAGPVAPGWYGDPVTSSWRYWDGRSWTGHRAPMASPG